MRLINLKENKEIIIIFIFLVLSINIICVFAEDAPAAGTGGTNNLVPVIKQEGTDYSKTNSYSFWVPGDEKNPLNIGNVVTLGADGKPGKPTDVQLGPGKFQSFPTSNEKEIAKGGEYKAAGNKDGKDSILAALDGKPTPDEGYFKSRGNEFFHVKDLSEVSIDKNGRVIEADIKGSEKGNTEATLDGKNAKLSIDIPKDAELTKKPGTDYQLKMPKSDEKTVPKLEMPRVEKKKPEEEDKEGYNPLLKIYSEGLTQLPDEVIKAANLPAGTKFQTLGDGALIYDSSNGGQWQTEGKVRFVTGDGKEIFNVNNMGKMYNNANERSYLFFGSDSSKTPEVKSLMEKGIAGVVVDGNNKFISSFSTNNKLGAYVELSEGNPFNGYKSSIMPDGKSGISIKESKVQFQGDGIFYGGQGIGYRKEGNTLFFKEGADLKQIFPNGGIENFAASNNFKAKIMPLDNAGNLISDAKKRLYIEAGIENGKATNKVIGLDEKGNPIGQDTNPGRVQGNLPSAGSNPASNINPGTAAPVKGLVTKSFPADRDAGGYKGIQGDVLSHAKPGAENEGMTEIGPGGSRTITTRDTDPSTGTHELEHDVNSRLRNEKGIRGYWGFYTGDNQAVYIKEPGVSKYDAASYVPKSLQGSRMNYIKNSNVGFDTSLYIFDEAWAYNMGSKAHLETGKGHVTGLSDFSVFGLAAGKAISEKNPGYWNSQDGTQFRAFLGQTLQESMSMLSQGAQKADSEQIKLLQNLRTSPDAESLRQFAKQTYGADWTKKVLGF